MGESEVVVVGAGPTGLMLAGELALAGVSCRVLERRGAESNLTRAFGVHARTLEVLDMRGLADELVARGLQVPEVRPRLGRRTVLRLPLQHPESRFPYVLIVAQARTEQLLEARAVALGVPIVRGAEVVGLRQDDEGVEVTVSDAAGTHTERAGYVVGCDGAHSAVRELLGVGFVGAAYATHILLADVRLDADLETAVNGYVSKHGFMLLPAFGDGWYRAVIWDRRRERVPLQQPVSVDEVGDSMRRIAGVDLGLGEMRWSTRFLSERRQADRYRVGRVFLAGDAAHVHSPIGALGMNTGIQDAMNLGWKLAAASRGWAPPLLLDTYHAERHQVGRAALRVTDLLQRITVAPAPVRAVRPLLARAVLAIPPVRRGLRRRVSGLSIGYSPPRRCGAHRWIGRRAPDARVGDARLYELLRSGRFLLITTSANCQSENIARTDWADRVDVVHAAADNTRDWPAITLIRPDGYIAWAADQGAGPGAVQAALSHWCQTSTTVSPEERE